MPPKRKSEIREVPLNLVRVAKKKKTPAKDGGGGKPKPAGGKRDKQVVDRKKAPKQGDQNYVSMEYCSSTPILNRLSSPSLRKTIPTLMILTGPLR